MDCPYSRIDIIGTNGNDGLHYAEMPQLAPSRKGDVAEYKAVIWLLEQGYEVFLNCCSTGPADMLVWKPETEEILKVDVKTASWKMSGGKKVQHLQPNKNEHLGITLLHYDPESGMLFWQSEKPANEDWEQLELDLPPPPEAA